MSGSGRTKSAVDVGTSRKLKLQRSARPALIALRSDQAHTLTRPPSAEPGCWMCACIHLNGPVGTLFLEEFAEVRILVLSEDEPTLRLAVECAKRQPNGEREEGSWESSWHLLCPPERGYWTGYSLRSMSS